MIRITTHAIERANERLQWKEPVLEKMATKAFTEGVDVGSAKGHLKKYIQSQFKKEGGVANKIRIHGEIVFIFNDNLLITLFQIPNDLKKLAKISKP